MRAPNLGPDFVTCNICFACSFAQGPGPWRKLSLKHVPILQHLTVVRIAWNILAFAWLCLIIPQYPQFCFLDFLVHNTSDIRWYQMTLFQAGFLFLSEWHATAASMHHCAQEFDMRYGSLAGPFQTPNRFEGGDGPKAATWCVAGPFHCWEMGALMCLVLSDAEPLRGTWAVCTLYIYPTTPGAMLAVLIDVQTFLKYLKLHIFPWSLMMGWMTQMISVTCQGTSYTVLLQSGPISQPRVSWWQFEIWGVCIGLPLWCQGRTP